MSRLRRALALTASAHLVLAQAAGLFTAAAPLVLASSPAHATCPASFQPTTIASDANCIFRDYSTDGVPSSGAYNTQKSDVRQWGAALGALVPMTAQYLDPQAVTSIQVSPKFCDYAQLNGTTSNNDCVSRAVAYACSTLNSYGTNVAGELIFARALYKLTNVNVLQQCAGLDIRGSGFGNPTSVSTHSAGTMIVSGSDCTGPIFNIYSDATSNYIYGGSISNLGFWNNVLSSGDPYGSQSCKFPLIQVNHALLYHARDLYAWQPYQFLKEVGGLYLDNENIYLDEALQDSPGEFEFTGWGANPATGQNTRQDQVLLQHAMMFANVSPQSGHKLPVGIWWHGFAVSLKTFDTAMEFASTALQVDCTTTGIAATDISACTAYGKFYDFEAEGANGGSGALIYMTDTQNNDFYQLYAAAFSTSQYPALGGSGYVMKVKNTTFHYTGVITVSGGQLNGAGASGIDYEGYELTVSGGTHIWGNNAAGVGGAEITLEGPVSGNTSGSHTINGNYFCAGPAGTGDSQLAINIIPGAIANDYIITNNNNYRGCSAGTYAAAPAGSHNVAVGNAGP